MCIYLGSEVILANLLSEKREVTLGDVNLYCKELEKILASKKINKKIYININSDELEKTLLKYNKEFRYFRGNFFINEEFNLDHFNSRFNEKIVNTLESVAKNI